MDDRLTADDLKLTELLLGGPTPYGGFCDPEGLAPDELEWTYAPPDPKSFDPEKLIIR